MRKSAIAAFGVAVVIGLAGCTTEGGEPETAIETGPATGDLRFESWTPTAEVFDEIVAGFTADNPDATVTGTLSPYEDYLTSLQTQLRAGDGPDVFVLQPGASLAQFREYIEPIDAYAEAFGGADWADVYNEAPLDRAQAEDVTYGLPLGYGVAGFLWMNRTLLEQVGVEVPENYEDLVAAASDLKAAGIEPIALGAKDTWQDTDYYLAIAAALDEEALYSALEGEGSWTEPALVEAFEHWGNLFEDGVVQDGAAGAATYTDTYDLFANGKAAFFANGSWNLDMYVNSFDLISQYNIDAIPFPVPGVDGGAPITGDVTGIVVVNAASENKGAAYQFASYLSQGDGSIVFMDAFLDFAVTVEPRTPSALPDEALQVRGSIEQLIADSLVGYRQVPSASVAEALGAALVGMATGGVTAEEAAQRVQDAADAA